MAATNPDNLNP
jgi:hypothetical protein